MDAQKIGQFVKDLHKEIYGEKGPTSNFWGSGTGGMTILAFALLETADAMKNLADAIGKNQIVINNDIKIPAPPENREKKTKK